MSKEFQQEVKVINLDLTYDDLTIGGLGKKLAEAASSLSDDEREALSKYQTYCEQTTMPAGDVPAFNDPFGYAPYPPAVEGRKELEQEFPHMQKLFGITKYFVRAKYGWNIQKECVDDLIMLRDFETIKSGLSEVMAENTLPALLMKRV